MNIYRGCTHGCIYCDSRSDCYQMDHEFEDVEVKINAPELLEDALRRKRKPCMIGTGSMSDPYLPLEKTERLTRKCLEIIYRRGCGVTLITKSDLVLRDIELLKSINERAKCVVQMTLTTYDDALCHIVEPNVAVTSRRFEVLQCLKEAGIPTIVWMTPTLPFINDTPENIKGILGYCEAAGVKGIFSFGCGLTLRSGDREYYYQKLNEHFPGLTEKYIATFGGAYEIKGPNADALEEMVERFCRRRGLLHDINEIFGYLSSFDDEGEQLSFF